MMKKFLFWFLLFLTIMLFLESFKTSEKNPADVPHDVYLETSKTHYTVGDFVVLKIHNGRDTAVTLPYDCPSEPMNVYAREKSLWKKIEAVNDTFKCPAKEITIQPGENYPVSYAPWNLSLFEHPGTYKIEVTLPAATDAGGEELTHTADVSFEVTARGIFGTIWHEGFFRPIYNTLIYFTSVVPGHSFGWSIIFLTLIIRIILLAPNQKALRSQREMQKIQPEIEAIKRKFEGNQEMIARKTMELWKEHKVNPMGSCLPILVQIPILIALFYVVQQGLDPFNTHLLYSGLQSFNIGIIDTKFLWLDLATIDRYWLPILVGILQFVQMKLVTAGLKIPEMKNKASIESTMHNMNKIMTWVMPVMIALMTASFPAGVGLYWGFSTIFGIGQQLVVNHERKRKKKSDGDGVRVIDANVSPRP